MATLEQLIAERDKLEAQIKEQQESARTDGIKQIRDIMQQVGLTLADLRTESAKPARAPKGKGGTVAAKYRDPKTGSTWSGRGLMPRWMKETGKPKETFAIAAER